MNEPEWVIAAQKIIGESEPIRNKAIFELKKSFLGPNDLLMELDGPYRHYALDVLVAWHDEQTLAELLNRLGSDRDGSMILAINAMVNKDNVEQIVDTYFNELNKMDRHSIAFTIAVVDFFGHLKRSMSDALLTKLTQHASMEVQDSAAWYLEQLAKSENVMVKKWIGAHYESLKPQVRARFVFLMQKLDMNYHKICETDRHAIVQSACRYLKRPKDGK